MLIAVIAAKPFIGGFESGFQTVQQDSDIIQYLDCRYCAYFSRALRDLLVRLSK